jgi:hypothetical protein
MTLKRKILLALAVIIFVLSGILYYHTTKNLVSHEGQEGEGTTEGEH